jgi:phospholipid/cholesterol/gamma-HCH transport system substrate-binding protein
LLLLAVTGCGGSTGVPFATCEVQSDCAAGSLCIEGLCVPIGGDADAEVPPDGTLAGEADKVAVKVQNLLSDETGKDLQSGAAGARQSLESLQAILKEQRGELKALATSLRRSAEGLEKVTTGPELDDTLKRVDKLVERLDGTVGTLDTSSKSLQSILGRMDRGEGTLGKLSTDETLYKNASEASANLNKATVELNKLLADFQAHPRKYINLKVF